MQALNTRLIEKTIFSGLDPDEGGDSEVIDLDGASKFSCQAVYTVDTPVDASVTFQKSNDGVNWNDIEVATAITTAGTVMVEQANVSYRYFKAVKAIGSGDVTLQAHVLVIGDS